MRMALIFSLVMVGCLGMAQPFQKCLTMEKTQARAEQSQGYQRALDALTTLSEDFASHQGGAAVRDVKEITIPVVVHVLFRDSGFNVSMEQIKSQIDVLNRDFNWQQSDKEQIPEVWRDLGAPTGFRFELADKDPDGNFTNGVTRKQVEVEDIGDTELYYTTAGGGQDPWFPPHYVNIWVCEIGGNVLGFTYLPAVNMQENDGIVIDPRAFGTTGTAVSPYNGGRTLVHEMGHFFGLRHPWGTEEGSCTNTDYMEDTPWQKHPNQGCATFPSLSCPSEPNGDMFMNFMDYGVDNCALLFTENQVDFMRLVATTARSTLIHSEAVTGVEPTSTTPPFAVNAALGMLWVEFRDKNNRVAVDVWNTQGQLVQRQVAENGIAEFSTSSWPAGVYVVATVNGATKIMIAP